MEIGANDVRRGNRVGRPKGVRASAADQPSCGERRAPTPRHPAIRRCEPPRIPPKCGQVAPRVERESSFDHEFGADLGYKIDGRSFVCPWMRGKDGRLPSERWQVGSEAQRTLDPAAACERRKMVGDHEHVLHAPRPRTTSSSHRSVQASTCNRAA